MINGRENIREMNTEAMKEVKSKKKKSYDDTHNTVTTKYKEKMKLRRRKGNEIICTRKEIKYSKVESKGEEN